MTTGCMVSFVSGRLCPLYLSLSFSLPVFVSHPLFTEAPCKVNVSCWFSTHSLTDTAIALVSFALIMVAMVLHAVCQTNCHLITPFYIICLFSHISISLLLQYYSTTRHVVVYQQQAFNNFIPIFSVLYCFK